MHSNNKLTYEKPMYEQIYDKLIEKIRAGDYSTGDKLPSEKELSNTFNVSRITSKKALEKLAQEGLIVRKRGKGSFVSESKDFTSKAKVEMPNNNTKLVVGLVISDFDNVYGARIIRSIETEIGKHHGIMILKQTMGDSNNEQEAIRELIDFGVNALIVMPVHGEYYSEEMLKLVINKFPLVLIDRNLKGIPTISISTNNIKSAEKLVEYLLDQGHTEIGLISSPPLHTTTIEDRIEGFILAHENRGIIPNRNLWVNSINSPVPSTSPTTPMEGDIQKIMQLLQDFPKMTALFCTEYNIALLAENAAKQVGLQVPQDLEIVCFDSIENEFDSKIRFPFIRQDEEKIGETAVQKITDIINGDQTPQQILIDGELIK